MKCSLACPRVYVSSGCHTAAACLALPSPLPPSPQISAPTVLASCGHLFPIMESCLGLWVWLLNEHRSLGSPVLCCGSEPPVESCQEPFVLTAVCYATAPEPRVSSVLLRNLGADFILNPAGASQPLHCVRGAAGSFSTGCPRSPPIPANSPHCQSWQTYVESAYSPRGGDTPDESCLWVLGQRQCCTGCVLSPFSCRMSGMISGGHNPLGTPGSSSSQSDLASLIQA